MDGPRVGRQGSEGGSGALLASVVRLLTFRITREELARLDGRHLASGLVCTWLVGMGRYWDDPGARWFQHLGIGSVLYVFALSAVLWLLVRDNPSAQKTHLAPGHGH